MKIAPPAKPRREAGTCGSTASAASTISAPPDTPAAKRQTKNQEKEKGWAQAKNDAVANNIITRSTTVTGATAAHSPGTQRAGEIPREICGAEISGLRGIKPLLR